MIDGGILHEIYYELSGKKGRIMSGDLIHYYSIEHDQVLNAIQLLNNSLNG